MDRLIAGVTLGTLLVVGGMGSSAWSADQKVIQTQKTKDVLITLKSESGQWSKGKKAFVMKLTSAKDKQPVYAGKVSRETCTTMSSMSPMSARPTLSPDKSPR